MLYKYIIRFHAHVLCLNKNKWKVLVALLCLLATYVHGYSSDFGPAVPLGLVFEVSPAGLQHGLVNTSTPSNNTWSTSNTINIT